MLTKLQTVRGIQERVAYEIMERSDFPLIRIGRCKRVSREEFFRWLDGQGRDG
ncbi:DNA-binding protein [Bacillus subtilis]|nr:DNA-binding protein [Bacillus subtilis]